jgi:hypothetical protein
VAFRTKKIGTSFRTYYSKAFFINEKMALGPLHSKAPLPLCVEMGFYGDILWESRFNIEINVGAHFY